MARLRPLPLFANLSWFDQRQEPCRRRRRRTTDTCISGRYMSRPKAYIIAARRAVNGRLGGLHRNRRVGDLCAPVIGQALTDAKIGPDEVDLVALGNTAAGSNPARLVALIAGLSERATTLTLDRHAASGLEALVHAVRTIATGGAEVAVAGGADSLSTAPWRLAKPRTLYHLPRFIGIAQVDEGEHGEPATVEAAERMARRLRISREQQDEFAITCHIKASLARDGRRLVGEIVALKSKPEETRDELVGEPDIEELESLPTLVGDGTLTAGNMSLPADGAAFMVVVSEAVHQRLGRPPALALGGIASIGVGAEEDLESPIAAARALAARVGGFALGATDAIELAETSAAQAIAFRDALALSEAALNADGGQVARGQPGAAASAVLVSRLFSRLVRDERAAAGARGVAIAGAAGGQAIAALLERV